MIRMYFMRTIKSPKFFISVFGVFIICMLRLTNGIFTATNIVDDIDLLVNLDAFRKVIAVFAAIPFASTFADEWSSNMSLSCVLRSSPKKYAWSQVTVCFLSAFITTLLGFLLYWLVDSFRLPLYIPDGNPLTPPYGVFLANGLAWLNILLVIVDFSLSCAMWSVTGLLISSIFPSSFIALCTPFVASYLLERITLNFPDQFNLLFVALSSVNILNNPWASFLWIVCLLSLLSAVFGAVFAYVIERRLKNEFT